MIVMLSDLFVDSDTIAYKSFAFVRKVPTYLFTLKKAHSVSRLEVVRGNQTLL